MELEIQETKENLLLDRVEVKFLIHHPNQPTPKRENVREQLSKELNVPKDRVIVDNMRSIFGVQDTRGYAKIYSKKEVALEVERKHLLMRNRLIEGEKKAKPAPEEPAAPKEEAKEEPPAEDKGKEKAKEKKKGEPEPKEKPEKEDKKEKKKEGAKPEKEDKKAKASEGKPAKEK